MNLPKLSPTRSVDLAATELRDAILDGRYPVGTRLPPERALAEQLGIARLTLRAALSRLEGEGLIHARQGSGIEVLPWRNTGGVALLPHLLDDGLANLGAFLVLRRAVAAEAVAEASRHATDADLDALQALADTLAAVTDRAALAEGNLSFARAVVRLADNLPVELLFNTVEQVYRARPDLAGTSLADPGPVRASFAAIVALLRRRDPDAARAGVRHLLEAIDAHTLATLEAA